VTPSTSWTSPTTRQPSSSTPSASAPAITSQGPVTPAAVAAARERGPREVVEEGVAHCDELSESRRGGEGRFDDLGLEAPSRFSNGGESETVF
jgi:hypothetical protein